MLLENKNAVIYGAAGGIGRGVALTFAREGARLFLAGRTREKLEAVAAEIKADGGIAEVAVVDALNEKAVEEYVQGIVSRAGKIDVSFNLINRGDVQGVPLLDISTQDLARAVTNGLTANFITARAAARHMVKQGSGVILMITSGSSFGAPPGMGSTPSADAATEALLRSLAAELGPQGVRVLGIWTAGVPETFTPEKLASVNSNMTMDAAALEGLKAQLAGLTMLRRTPALARVADVAAFLASDRASAMTSTIVNVTCGLVPW
jgi:NAD(P)-dependent dehydrogenase (short-subunit alcohol dehydrogenase family)